MKKIFLFLFGILGLVVAGAICLFVFMLFMPARQQSNSTSTNSNTAATGLTSTLLPDAPTLQMNVPGQGLPPPNFQGLYARTIAIDVTLHIPPVLEGVITPESALRGIVRDGTLPRSAQTRFADLFPSEGAFQSVPTPKFPKKTRLLADKAQFLAAIGPSRRMAATFSLCLGAQREACMPPETPRVSVVLSRTIREEELASGLIDMGDVYFNSFHPKGIAAFLNPEVCRTGEVTGNIVPTKEFLDKLPKDKKVAVFFSGFMINFRLADKALKKESVDPWPYLYYADFINVSPQGAKFAFPFSKLNGVEGLVGFAALCDATDTLQACAKKHFPGTLPASADGMGFRLVSEGLRFRTCSEPGDFNFILHWFPPLTEFSKPSIGKDRNPALPPEIIEGQLFP